MHEIDDMILELKETLPADEIIEGYFETSNYSSELERKSPIFAETSISRYLFVDEWVWNTIFVVTNKNLYLINTKQDFEKISTQKVPLENIEYINIYESNADKTIALKIKNETRLQYKSSSDKFLDILNKLDKTNIMKDQKPLVYSNTIWQITMLITLSVIFIVILIISFF